MSPTQTDLTSAKPAGLLRRLGAIFYDSLLVTAVVFVAFTAIYLPLAIGLGQQDTSDQPLWTLYIVCVIMVFFVWFWTHGGQTLGMRVWRIKLFSEDGTPVSYQQALVRFTVAILSMALLGLGFIWCLFNEDKRAWHDIASRTRLIVMKSK